MKNTIIIDTEVAKDGNKLITSAEAYKALVSSLASPINELAKVSSHYAQSGLASVAESFRETMGSYLATQSSYMTRNIIAESLRISLLELGNVLNECHRASMSNIVASMTETINVVTLDIISEQIRQLRQIDFSTVLEAIIPEASSLSEVVNMVYARMQEGIEANTESDDFTEEEIQEAIQEQMANPIGFQEKIANWSEKKIKKFFIFYLVIRFLCANFIQPYFQEKVGMSVMTYIESNVKELPGKGAEIVGKIKENVEAIILEDINYYYKVSFTDENGEVKEGYVAKRNLKLIEEETEEVETECTTKSE